MIIDNIFLRYQRFNKSGKRTHLSAVSFGVPASPPRELAGESERDRDSEDRMEVGGGGLDIG